MISFNEIAGNTLLFFLVFGMSATVDIHMLLQQLRNAKAIFMGVFLQFVILPLCGFLVVKFFQLEQNVGITLLVVTSSPGGSYSNWYVLNSYVLVIYMSICCGLSFFVTPLLTHSISLDPANHQVVLYIQCRPCTISDHDSYIYYVIRYTHATKFTPIL